MYTEQSAFIDTFEYLMQHLPDAHPVLMPRTEWGHFGPLEQPETVAAHILDRLGGGAAAPLQDADGEPAEARGG